MQLLMRMGLPHVILSDNGKELNNELDDLLSELLGIKRRLKTPYHPQVTASYTCICICIGWSAVVFGINSASNAGRKE